MSDDQVRKLERRFRASGSPADEVAWLRARYQAGELQASMLALACHCGYEPASAVMNLPPLPLGKVTDLKRWALELGRWWPREVWVRAALSAAHHVAPLWSELIPADPRLAEAIAATERWILAPSEERAEDAYAAAIQAGDASDELNKSRGRLGRYGRLSEAGLCMGVLGTAAWAAHVPHERYSDPFPAGQAFVRAQSTLEDGLRLGYGQTPATEALLRAAQEALVPWALGTSDPVRTRVATKGQTEVRPDDLVP